INSKLLSLKPKTKVNFLLDHNHLNKSSLMSLSAKSNAYKNAKMTVKSPVTLAMFIYKLTLIFSSNMDSLKVIKFTERKNVFQLSSCGYTDLNPNTPNKIVATVST